MSAPNFQPRQNPQLRALHRILDRVWADLGALGVAITTQDRRFTESPTTTAALGIGAELVSAQLAVLGGPSRMG